MKQLSTLRIIGVAALLIAAPFSLQWSQKNVSLSLDSAEARTATRIAGVSLRVHPTYRCAVFGTVVFCAVPRIHSTWERIDTAPHISLHLRAAATTYHLSISRHLTTTVSVRSAFAAEEGRR